MIRSLFLALGIFCCVIGAQCLAIDEAVFRVRKAPEASQFSVGESAGEQIKFQPPDWAPWSLMSAGAVTILYAFALPKRLGQGG